MIGFCSLVKFLRFFLGISLAGMSAGGPAARAAVSLAVGSACNKYGFFYIKDHGVDPALIGQDKSAQSQHCMIAPASVPS